MIFIARRCFSVQEEDIFIIMHQTELAIFSQKECLIDQAAKDFKVKADECTASILNKLGIQFINSKQETQVCLLF